MTFTHFARGRVAFTEPTQAQFIAAQLTLTRSPRRARPVTLPRFDRDGSQNEVRA